MRVIVSVFAFCAMVNSWPKPPPPRPPPRPPPPPPPPAGAPAGGAGAEAGSITHLPEKSGLACAARLAAAPNISTTATIRKFRRIMLPFECRCGCRPRCRASFGSYPHRLRQNIKRTLRNQEEILTDSSGMPYARSPSDTSVLARLQLPVVDRRHDDLLRSRLRRERLGIAPRRLHAEGGDRA